MCMCVTVFGVGVLVRNVSTGGVSGVVACALGRYIYAGKQRKNIVVVVIYIVGPYRWEYIWKW